MIGTTLSHFRITAKLGEGGMGEVYRAEDTTLDREVALKVLPADLSSDPDRLARFEREAKTLAALDHPNIVTIHTVEESGGVHFLTMQLIEGKPLSELIPRGGMPPEEISDIAIPLADALADAHEKGVIHRDLKPANIMVTDEGRVMVLDFGLAKLSPWSDGGESQAETLASPAHVTRPGLALGTVSYMSPEQALGKELDRRTDLFSLGVVLYEMTTGLRPFGGEASGAILNEIINQAPTPVLELNSELPEPLGGLVEKCLEKDPDLRYQSARGLLGDLKRLQRDTTSGASTIHPTVSEEPGRRKGVRWISVGLLGVGLAGLAWWLLPGKTPEASLPLPSFTPFTTDGGWKDTPRLSPDGERVAYAWREPTKGLDIYVKGLGFGAEPHRLTDDPGEEAYPVFSPDGREIAFVRSGETGGAIYVVPSLGGRERKLVDLAGVIPGIPSLSWSPDGRWLAFSEQSAEDQPARIVAISLETLQRKDLTLPPQGIGGDFSPEFSPDGRQLAFVRRVETIWGNNDVWVQSLEGGKARRLTTSEYVICRGFTWTADSGEVVFWTGLGSTERVYRVSVTDGDPEPVSGTGVSSAYVSVRGNRMVYRQASYGTYDIWRIPGPGQSTTDRTPERLISSSGLDGFPAFSLDGGQVAFSSTRSGVDQIWRVQSDGSRPTQLTNFKTSSGTPAWSPDGGRIVFDSLESGSYDLWVVDAEGGVPRQLTFEPSEAGTPSWSRDGRWIYFHSDRGGAEQIWKIPADGGEAVQITQEGGIYARESWDGRTLYYANSQGPTGVWKVPVDGGEEIEIVPEIIPYFLGWDLSQSGIYYLTGPAEELPGPRFILGVRTDFTLHFLDLATGEVSDLFRREGVSLLRDLAVSPDEKWILYTEISAGTAELILIENFR